jgi:hypothetical protein
MNELILGFALFGAFRIGKLIADRTQINFKKDSTKSQVLGTVLSVPLAIAASLAIMWAAGWVAYRLMGM